MALGAFINKLKTGVELLQFLQGVIGIGQRITALGVVSVDLSIYSRRSEHECPAEKP